jgi:hypothetical protein
VRADPSTRRDNCNKGFKREKDEDKKPRSKGKDKQNKTRKSIE